MKHLSIRILSVEDVAPWDDGIPANVQSVHLVGFDGVFAGAIRQEPGGPWAVTGTSQVVSDDELQNQCNYLQVISEFPQQVPA